MLEVIEDLYIDLIIRSMLLKQFAKTICKIIALGKLEDRLMNLLAEPYHSLSDELRGPFTWANKPRSHISGKKARRVLIYIERNIIMLLEI